MSTITANERGPSVDPNLLRLLRAAMADALQSQWERIADEMLLIAAEYSPDDIDAALDRLLDDDQVTMATTLQSPSLLAPMARAFQQGERKAELQFNVTFGHKDPRAMAYAADRAAELVGMRKLPDGSLIENPSAWWRIDEGTRNDLHALVNKVMRGETAPDAVSESEQKRPMSYRDLKRNIENHPAFPGLFGEARAEMIARSELGIAANQGHVAGFEGAGITEVDVLDNPTCKLCGPFANTRQTLQWARDNPLGHPHCVRSFNAVIPKDEPLTTPAQEIQKLLDAKEPWFAPYFDLTPVRKHFEILDYLDGIIKEGEAAAPGITVGLGLQGHNLEGQEKGCEHCNPKCKRCQGDKSFKCTCGSECTCGH